MTTCPLGLARRCYCANQVSSFASAPAETAVLLLAHGSPENPDQIPEFLSYVTGGRPLPPSVVEEIRHRYSLIGFSPLACWTLLQADQLSQSLQMPVFVGMRNWKPFIGDTVKAITAQRYEACDRHLSRAAEFRTSVGLYREFGQRQGRSFRSQWISSRSGTIIRFWSKPSRKNCARVGRRPARKAE